MSNKYERSEWFMNERFGMFIHWGLYAIPARGEWIRCKERMENEVYDRYFYEFDPQEYCPKEWAKLAKDAGMRYAVLTAKHHDGFCLFDSKLTDFKSTNTRGKRDIVKEFLEAFRAEGIKVGLYYSLLDWHHKDYPVYDDLNHPMRQNEKYKDYKYDWSNYLSYMHGQVEELCRNYGKLDILWFDYSYGRMKDETWKAKELIEMVRKYQPEIVIDNRLETSAESFGSIVTKTPNSWAGDFVSPEHLIPPSGILDCEGNPAPWEACITMNNHWGYCGYDNDYKDSEMIIKKLVECVSKGGNMILNVGPDANGCIPEQSVKVLKEVGAWIQKNGESIYGCGISNLEKPEWGRYTRKGNKLYAHIFEPAIGPLALTGIEKSKVKEIRILSNKSEVKKVDIWIVAAYDDIVFINFGEIDYFTYMLPDKTDTVIVIDLEESSGE